MSTETWYIHSLNVSIGSYLGQFLGLEAIHQVFMWAVYGHTCWVLRRFNGAGMETGASHSPRSRFPGQLVVITQHYIPYFCFSSSTRLMYSFMAFSLLLPYRQIKNVLWREKKTDRLNEQASPAFTLRLFFIVCWHEDSKPCLTNSTLQQLMQSWKGAACSRVQYAIIQFTTKDEERTSPTFF